MTIHYHNKSRWSLTKAGIIWLLTFKLALFSWVSQANQAGFEQAELALKNQQYEDAGKLFNNLLSQEQNKTKALFGLARLAFFQEQLDRAEEQIEEVLTQDSSSPEHLYFAARIAGKQAQSASIFTKLGYAKDTKKYFTQAIELDSRHKPSIIGLIRFHQQAPVIAGGDKDAIADLLESLSALDKRAAFAIQAPLLINQNKSEEVFNLYKEALATDTNSDTELGEFKFNFAMLLASQEMYLDALAVLTSINLTISQELPGYVNMRLYQIAKLAAESKSNLDLGIDSINQYASIADGDRTIPDDWVRFRLAQLQYLKARGIVEKEALQKMRLETKDDDLKSKIKSFLKES